MSIPSDLLSRALELERQDREELVQRLIVSLEPEDETLTPEEWEAAWAEEIEKRLRDLDEGRSELIPWEEVRDRLRARREPGAAP